MATASSTCSTRRATRTFSEDTYRTLTAVDSAVMVIDAAKGIEARTRKLFEVCRLRDIPIVTFINKLDREARDPFELLDENREDPGRWMWRRSPGPSAGGGALPAPTTSAMVRVRRLDAADDAGTVAVSGVGRFRSSNQLLTEEGEVATWREEAELAESGLKRFDLEAFREGHLTPVFFGSALRNFGVRDLIDGLARFAPAATRPGLRQAPGGSRPSRK